MIRHLLKPTTFVAALALVGASIVAVAPSAMAAPAPGAYTVSASGIPSSITTPKTGTKTYKFKVNISGTAADTGYTDSNGDGAQVRYTSYDQTSFKSAYIKRTSSVAKGSSYMPSVRSTPLTLTTGANSGYELRIPYYTIPGKYSIKIPVGQRSDLAATPYTSTKTTKWVTKSITVKANTSYSKKSTSYYAPSWKTGATAKFTLTAPAYQKGGKVVLYVKKKGSKKYKKVTSTKLKKKGSYSTTAKFKAKNLRPGDKILVKIGKVKYSKGYSLKAQKIKRIY